MTPDFLLATASHAAVGVHRGWLCPLRPWVLSHDLADSGNSPLCLCSGTETQLVCSVPRGMREPLPKTSQPASSQEPGASSVPCPQVRLALLQLKGLEDSYNGRLDFPRDRITLAPFGFL